MVGSPLLPHGFIESGSDKFTQQASSFALFFSFALFLLLLLVLAVTRAVGKAKLLFSLFAP